MSTSVSFKKQFVKALLPPGRWDGECDGCNSRLQEQAAKVAPGPSSCYHGVHHVDMEILKIKRGFLLFPAIWLLGGCSANLLNPSTSHHFPLRFQQVGDQESTMHIS
jgi:hypothetical protein